MKIIDKIRQKNKSEKKNMPEFIPANSQDLYRKRNDFSISAKNFLYKPASYVLKGPIFIIFLFIFSAFFYSFIATTETKVASTIAIIGNKYVIQSPVTGSVNSILIDRNEDINSQQSVITLLSETQLASRENLAEIENSMEKIRNNYKEINFAIKRVNDLAAYYKLKNERFEVEPVSNIKNHPDELSLEQYKILSDTAWENSDYFNIVQQTSVRLTELWAGYQRSYNLMQKQKKMYEEDQKLYDKNVITEYQIAESHQNYLALIAQTDNYVNSFKIEIYSVLQRFTDIRNQIIEKYLNLRTTYNESKLLGDDIIIEDKVVIMKSKYPGVVANLNVKNYEYVNRGMPLITVIRNDLPKTGITYISDQSIGKVKIGQEVFIKFPAYPYQEYGIQKGRITDIAADAKIIEGYGLAYEAEVSFEKINSRINLKYGMQGNAEIATGTKRLIELVFEPMTKVFDYIEGVQDGN